MTEFDETMQEILGQAAGLTSESPRSMAERLARMYEVGGITTLRRWRDDYYLWSAKSGCYAHMTDAELRGQIYQRLPVSDAKMVSNVIDALLATDILIDSKDLGDWLTDPKIEADPLDLAVAPNGIVNLGTGQLCVATPALFTTSCLGSKYDPAAGAEPKLWLEFLRQLWPSDEDAIRCLQEWFGLQLTPDTTFQKILLLIGPKRSGKGTISRVMQALLGRASCCAPTLASIGTNFGMQPLIGKTAAVIGDARLGGRSDIAQIVERLLSLSGEDPITVDRKHKESWTGDLKVRVTLVSNELPKFDDASGALAGRFVILETKTSFYAREDRTLTKRLMAELPQILNWAIAGWTRLRARGYLTEPRSSRQLGEDLAELASPVNAWLKDRTSRSLLLRRDQWVSQDAAYRDYKIWAMAHGHREITSTMFGRNLRAMVAGLERVQVDRTWRWPGIALRRASHDELKSCASAPVTTTN